MVRKVSGPVPSSAVCQLFKVSIAIDHPARKGSKKRVDWPFWGKMRVRLMRLATIIIMEAAKSRDLVKRFL